MGKERTTIRVVQIGPHAFCVKRHSPGGIEYTIPNTHRKTKAEAVVEAKKIRMKERWRIWHYW